ncbi:MAG TPA: hypothetical protein VKU77_05025 [Streptosporangiaceae bacterium]|nr:hypothetical protein [Streptosporangiaceae bacterium]
MSDQGDHEAPTSVRPAPGGSAAQIRAALNGPGEVLPLDLLGPVLTWTVEVLRRDAASTPAAAFRAVAAADRALAAAPEFFATLSALVALGEPSAEVAADLGWHARQLAELERRLAARRERLSELLAAEERMRAEAAREDEIAAQIAELERIERLAAHVAELRAQRDLLADRTKAMTAAVTGAEAELAAAGQPLITLSGELLNDLAEQTRALLLRAAGQDQLLKVRIAEHRQAAERAAADTGRCRAELAEAEAAAAAAQAEYESVQANAAGHLAALRRYQQANHDVADALAARPERDGGAAAAGVLDPVAEALHALGGVQARLAEIDALLASAIQADEPPPPDPAAAQSGEG